MVRKVASNYEIEKGRESPEFRQDKVGLENQIVFASTVMRKIIRLFEIHAPFTKTILLRGESGVGKEPLARFIHEISPRSSCPYIVINCAGKPDSLIEAECFGYVRGAFTGASRSRSGLFTLADEGTIFLDEIGKSSLDFQAKILRVIEDGEIWPLGSTTPIKVDFRIVMATNANLEKSIAEGLFYEDLYWRSSQVEIFVPPLRERTEDIPPLVEHFIKSYSAKHSLTAPHIEPGALSMLLLYDWPGNVRQLKNTIERAVIENQTRPITAEGLNAILPQKENYDKSLEDEMADLERRRIVDMIAASKDDKVAAQNLKCSLSTFKRKKKHFNIDSRQIRKAAEGLI